MMKALKSLAMVVTILGGAVWLDSEREDDVLDRIQHVQDEYMESVSEHDKKIVDLQNDMRKLQREISGTTGTLGSLRENADSASEERDKMRLDLARVRNAMRLPTPIVQIVPVYPTSACRGRMGRTVTAIVEVDADGHVADVRFPNDQGGVFSASVRTAVEQWEYQPPGHPIAVSTAIEFRATGQSSCQVTIRRVTGEGETGR